MEKILGSEKKNKKRALFFLENYSPAIEEFIQQEKEHCKPILFTRSHNHLDIAAYTIKHKSLGFFYKWIALFLLYSNKNNTAYIFCNSPYFLRLLKKMKARVSAVPIIFLYTGEKNTRQSKIKEFIALADLFVTDDKTIPTLMEISSTRFVFVEDHFAQSVRTHIHHKNLAQNIPMNAVQKAASLFGISYQKAFEYVFFWWKQHYKPVPGCNYFLLLDIYEEKMNIDKNPILLWMQKENPAPYTMNIIPNKKSQNLSSVGKVALHIHMYYKEFSAQIYTSLKNSPIPLDLYITTTQESNIAYIEEQFAPFEQGSVNIKSIYNRGRDISAFLCHYQSQYKEYEYIGHIHTKKSAHLTPSSSSAWREYLFSHLIGSRDILRSIFSLFCANKKLGLLFPDDPRLPGWSSIANKEIARTLMSQIDPSYKFPYRIEFPVGTMFWARYEAIAPLFDLQWKHDDFPEEPIAADGTVAHAIERIFPCVCESSGFTWETLKIPNLHMGKLRHKK